MATQAERMENSGKPTAALKEAADEVSAAAKNAFEQYEASDEDDHLRFVHDNHGLHAYRYEVLDDDSVVALYANDPSGEVKVKAFESLAEASKWSPRQLRNEE